MNRLAFVPLGDGMWRVELTLANGLVRQAWYLMDERGDMQLVAIDPEEILA